MTGGRTKGRTAPELFNTAQKMEIEGIRCEIEDESIQEIIKRVLNQIKSRAPEDYQRLCKRVRAFKWFSSQEEQEKEGILGRSFGWYEEGGEIKLAKRVAELPESRQIAVVAHELGHAATTMMDFCKRDVLDEGWTSEICADYYAYKWGFGRQIRAHQRCRVFDHNPLLPGDIVEIEGIGRFTLTRAFYIKFLSDKET